jgi:hypothetical protein
MELSKQTGCEGYPKWKTKLTNEIGHITNVS